MSDEKGSEETQPQFPIEAAERIMASASDAMAAIMEAAGLAWEQVKPIVLAVKRDTETRTATIAALGELFGATGDETDEDEIEAVQDAAKALADLDVEQLKDAENALVATSLLVSRLRKAKEES